MSSLIALHEPTLRYAYPLTQTTLRLCLRLTPIGEGSVCVRYRNKNHPEDPWHTQSMMRMGFDGMLDAYETTLQTPEKTAYLQYVFVLATEQGEQFYTAHGLFAEEPSQGYFEYLCTHESQLPTVPAWARNAVVYQIFPDRFARSPDVAADRPLRAWDAPPDSDGFWGGNLRGIESRIPYLQTLGVDAVYLNPVFLSVSNHRYDTADYDTVDPLLGSQADLVHLSQSLHAAGIRLLLDGVFNHCGLAFPPFRDVALRGPASPYWGWFSVQAYPLCTQPPSYDAIGYYSAMPKLRQANPEVQSYFLNVAEKWTRLLALDGWRLDVADEIDPVFLARLQVQLRAVNPEILLLGEAWQENPPLTRAGLLHGIINYPLHRAMLAFFAEDAITPAVFAARACRSLFAYPEYARPINACMLGCHDTPRFWSRCGQNLRRLRCALAFLTLWPGIDLLYYGDEAGLTGGGDPDCRRAMPWGNENPDVEAIYREYVHLRKLFRGGEAMLEDAFLPTLALRSARDGTTVAWAFINMGEEHTVEIAWAGPPPATAFTTAPLAHSAGMLRIPLTHQACALLWREEAFPELQQTP